MKLTKIKLDEPYLLFMGDVPDDDHAKTGHGIKDWRADKCAAQMRLPGCKVDMQLPEMTATQAAQAGVRTAIIGIASTGGQIPDHWLPSLTDLARNGIDIASGMHSKLHDIPQLVAAASEGGGKLIDVRMPPADLPVGLGRKRTGSRVLMVGTDCAVGKKYSALALHRELQGRDVDATFRATGQTGIMIAGEGIPIDSVVADFISGAAETLSPDNSTEHWDVIEGQGSLVHPSYAGVSLGLLHGSQPDAIVLCHESSRSEVLGLEGYFELPALDVIIAAALAAAHVTNNKCYCAGISVNTSSLTADERNTYLSGLREQYGLPAVDPLISGMADIADRLVGEAP